MLGQEQLINKIDSFTLETMPKTILLVGESGCGKKTLIKYISEKFNLETLKIQKNVSQEELIDFQQCPIKKLYIIDLEEFTEKQQNQFLKFIEEPSKNVYIILTAESENGILYTIKNRCIKYTFREYSIEQLQKIKFFDNELAYKICKTPGQLLNITQDQILKLDSFCDLFIDKLNIASFANTVSISNKINYKDEYDKFDFNLFFNMLKFKLANKFIETNDQKFLSSYKFILDYLKDNRGVAINKENFMINFLIDYKQFNNQLLYNN